MSHKFYPDVGGIESVSEMLANEFIHYNHEVHVVTWSFDSTYKDFPFKIIRNPGLQTLFQEHIWADIIFENNPCVRLSWPNLFIRRPLVIGLHTWIAKPNGKIGLSELLKFKWLNRAQNVIACSDAIRKDCFVTSTVITNPYDNNTFSRIPEIEKTKDYVFLGRLVSDKGADVAIKAFQRFLYSLINDRKITSTLTIIGAGPEYASLQTLAKDLGIADRVIFTGSMTGDALARCLNQHRYLLVPSVWKEPFGIVVLEGMACGCIPIVSDGGGLPDAVGQAGLVFKRGDVDNLAESMLQLVNTPELETQLRRAAQQHLAPHQFKVTARRYLDLLEQTAASKNL